MRAVAASLQTQALEERRVDADDRDSVDVRGRAEVASNPLEVFVEATGRIDRASSRLALRRLR